MKYFLLCLFLPLNCLASIGTITDQLNKPPSIEREKNVLIGSKGTGILMNDIIKTDKGQVGIKFEDNTTVQINEHSRLVVDDFVYDPKSSKGGKLAIRVALGTVRYASGQIAKNSPQAVQISTPTATIAVRGTDFTATVDELGGSTIILLPSCPPIWIDIEKDCKTGIIEVSNLAGSVILNAPFHATKVSSSDTAPTAPIVINLSLHAINNLLIVTPPRELVKVAHQELVQRTGLDQNFLVINVLGNELDKTPFIFDSGLTHNLLDQDFLANILDIINSQLAAQQDLLNTTQKGLLPDWVATTGVTVQLDEPELTLCRDDGSNVQCVTTPTTQNTTIIQQQGSIEITNRVNSGGNTYIILKQN